MSRLIIFGDVKHIKDNQFEITNNIKQDWEGFFYCLWYIKI